MTRLSILVIVCLLSYVYSDSSTGVRFPSGKVFEPITLEGDLAEEHADPFNTGSELYDSTGEENFRLSLNYHVRDYKSTASQYYRAHPVLMQCLQKVRTAMYKQGEKVIIKSGFRTKTEASISSDKHIQYLRSGSAAVIEFKQPASKTVEDLLQSVVKNCINLFHAMHRDIGVGLFADSVHVHIQGHDEDTPYYYASQDAAMNVNELEEFVAVVTDEVYEPMKTPQCDVNQHILSDGEHYPSHYDSPEAAVGALDTKVTRIMEEDFARLIQYAGRNVKFENSEKDADWCGSEDRQCVDCTDGIKGSTPANTCADRMMSNRLNSAIKYLQKMVRNQWTPEVYLKVLDAWDEAYEGAPDGDHPADSLHYEGRAATVKLDDNDSDKLNIVASLAICAGADYVEHKGDHLFLAVKKQAGILQRYEHFPIADLLSSECPAGDDGIYKLPDGYSQDEKDKMLLFDSDHKESRKLSAHALIGDIKSPSGRYFRISPLLIECYQSIVTRENKDRKENDPFINIIIDRAYLTNDDQVVIPDTDPRYNHHVTGRAMQIRYNQSSGLAASVYTPYKLIKRAIHKCGSHFTVKGYSIGAGLYQDSVYIDMRDNFDAWVESDQVLPNGETEEEFRNKMELWLQKSVEGRVIDPDNPARACLFSVQPQRQSPDYEHVHPEPVRRRRAAGVDPDSCQPRSDTPFCSNTKKHRDKQVKIIWEQVTRKHLYHDKDEVKEALDNCFGACGTCQQGDIWWDKIENCDNFLHWVPFDFYEQHDEVAFYVRTNTNLKPAACRGHCIDKSPLFSLVAPSVEQLYRPKEDRSVKEPLYSVANNPLPVYDLLYKLYGLTATGLVRVYVKDETELTTLRGPLQMAMIYNKDVTRIEFYVENEKSVEPVISDLEDMLLEWTKSTCTDHTRESVPPFTVELMPTGINKRSAEHNLREELLAKRRNWEKDWLASHTFL